MFLPTFRTGDVISFAYIGQILVVMAAILAVTYLILLISSKKLRTNQPDLKKINVLETRHIPKIGSLCLISISEQKYLIVNSATGVAVTPLANIDEHKLTHV